MSKEKIVLRKNTSLSIVYVEGIKSEEGIIQIVKELGCPVSAVVDVENTWKIESCVTEEVIETFDSGVAKFIREHDRNSTLFTVEVQMRSSCDYGSWENKEYLGKMFDSVKDHINTSVDSIYRGSIDLSTYGYNTTPKKVEELHRKNMLILKDRIVSSPIVQRVDYTCAWRKTSEEECTV
ncbi:MAG: hypothetical protein EPN25_15420 [Nitrospirae bacterium]|nr:MAG: hypothetical protein EPN25_15420 [Nitrospirota bacterium]